MAALTNQRDTPHLSDPPVSMVDQAVKTNVKLFRGGIVVTDATGYGIPAATATGLICVGICDPQDAATAVIDATGVASGGKIARVAEGCHRIGNSSAGDLIGQTEIGKVCYLVDDQTVAKTDGTGTRSKAGVVENVDAQGVWVRMSRALSTAI